MEMQIIATRDIMANVYGPLMQVPHLGQAIRSFGDECRRKEQGNILALHPEHFELWHLGTYDDWTGIISPFKPEERKQLAVGANYTETLQKDMGAKGEIIEHETTTLRRELTASREKIGELTELIQELQERFDT